MKNLNLSDFKSCGENPSVYVGTYAKYNEGSIYGMWIDLVACGDYDTFHKVCRQLHSDERDPELMFQDYENFPGVWYSESCMDEDTFGRILEFAELSDDLRDAFEAFSDAFGNDCIDSFKDRYMGKWDSEKEFAEYIVDECYNLDSMMGHLASYFDYEAYARDLFIDDYYFTDGYVFRRG
jgi:antirestriction protein